MFSERLFLKIFIGVKNFAQMVRRHRLLSFFQRLERFRQIGNLTQTVGIRAEQMILIIFREKGHEIIERVILGETHRSLCAEHGQVFNDEKRLQIAVPHAGQILIDRADADMHAKTVKERVFFQNIMNRDSMFPAGTVLNSTNC